MVDSSEDGGFSLRENRFAALGTHTELPDRPRRRLVLVSQQDDHGVDHEWDSDTDTVGGGSDVDVGEILECTAVETPVASMQLTSPICSRGVSSKVRSVPHVLSGVFRTALRVVGQEILEVMETDSEVRVVRGWKFMLVLPRMMLFRPSRRGTVSRKKLESGVRQFQEGDWISLLRESVSCADVAHSSAVRRRRRGSDEEAVRAARVKPWKEHRWHLESCHFGDAHRPDKEIPCGEEGSQS